MQEFPFWESCRNFFQQTLPAQQYNTWIRPLPPADLVLLVHSGFVAFVVGEWGRALAPGGLCLDEDVQPATGLGVGARQLIHIQSGSRDQVTFVAESATGTIQNALIEVQDNDRARLSFLLGRALGLERSTDRRLSIMSFPETDRTGPGPDDLTSLRVLYGPPEAWCR